MSIKHLNQRQLAERWGVSEASLERWRTEGIGPIFLKLQGRIAYRLEDVEAFEAQNRKRPADSIFPAVTLYRILASRKNKTGGSDGEGKRSGTAAVA